MRWDAESLRALLDEAKWGRPDPGDVDTVADALAARQIAPTSEYTALHIVGRTSFPRHEALVAGFLDGQRGAMLARLALKSLCSWYGVGDRYRAELLNFVEWVPWDEFDDVRLVAISAAGELLRDQPDPALFAALVAVAQDEAEVLQVRAPAVMALARAMGDDWSELPPATASDINTTWANLVIDRALQKSD